MKLKRLMMVLMVGMVIVALTACGHSKESTSHSHTDHQTKYHRIISLMPSNTEILYRLGLGKDVIGVSTADDYPKAVKHKKKFDSMKLNKEALLKAKPDLILAHESQQTSNKETLDSLKKSGVKVVYVKDAQSIQQMYDSFKQVGRVTGKDKQAEELVTTTKKKIHKVVASVPEHKKEQRVFMEVSSEPEIYTAGKHTFFNDMLKKLHAQNCFSDLKGWQKVSKEQIIRQNPDIIVGTTGQSNKDFRKMIDKQGGMDKTTAVKEGNVQSVNGDQISRPGPRIDEGLKELRDALYQ
ncbi:ABC transporter substrate-binding protein [Staphylococcus sp. SQ8-PEA]|uniref:ABC transporter substrate-binding protein n=1 Tax=Staphylococcus marylandisciuri TaxID=2981529 RepID=A0ABT2QSB2_9STAP|nr:ABC transporter substrate-binding protein [Staphylococcus marylandisciuri]MCU5746883.1 ABC transporter substrate-binding protein [Staphylococcus marylandisciuri]